MAVPGKNKFTTRPLSPNKERAILTVNALPFLTTAQYTKLYYPDTQERMLNDVQVLFNDLTKEEYFERTYQPAESRVGSGPFLYHLGAKGYQYLEQYDLAPTIRRKPTTIHDMGGYDRQHVRAINEVLVAARLLPRYNPRVALLEHYHDLYLKRYLGKARKIPDALLTFELFINHDWWLQPVVVEVERTRHTKEQVYWKMQRILALYHSPQYEALTHTPDITIAFVLNDARWISYYRDWILAALAKLRAEHFKPVIYVTATETNDISPTIFIDPVWIWLEETGRYPLLNLSEVMEA